MKPILVGLVVIDRPKTTEECLARLFDFTPADMFDLVIVDNGSNEETQKMLERYKRHCKNYFRYDFNSGCAFGINRWMSCREPGQHCIDINADVHLYSEWTDQMLSVIGRDDIGVVAGHRPEFWIDRPEKYAMYKSGVVYPEKVNGYWCEFVKNNLIIGPFWMMKSSLIDQIGYMSEFNCFDDIDHGYRVQATGLKSCYVVDVLMKQPQWEEQHHPQYGSHKALLERNRGLYSKSLADYMFKRNIYCGTTFEPETMERCSEEYRNASGDNWKFLRDWKAI
jgi:GT2 family glycosyltransferase